MASRNGFRSGVWCALFLPAFIVLSFTGAALAKEGLKFSLDPTWMFAGDETVGKTYMMTFVPQGQSREDWQSLFEIVETTRKSYPKKVEEARAALVNARLETCPDTRDDAIEMDDTSVIFEMATTGCAPNPDQYQLTRILYGKKTVYVMIFTHKAAEPPAQLREGWLKILRAAMIQ